MDDEPSDRASVPGNVLLETDARDDREGATCADLLDLDEAGDVDVILVVVGEPLADHLDALKRHARSQPANVSVVSVRDADLVVRSEKRREETPGGLTIRRISDPRDLTGIGMAVSEFLSAGRGDGNRTVVCLDSLTALLEYTDARRVYQFCNDLTGKLKAANVRAHFHLAPDAHDERTVRRLASLFDRRVTATDAAGASDAAEEEAGEAAAAADSIESREQADLHDAVDSPSLPVAVAGGGSPPSSGPGGLDSSDSADDENAGWPIRYDLYQRMIATVVGIVALLVLLSVIAAAMPIPLGGAPVDSAGDGPATTTETAVAAADADDEVADAEAVSTPTSTATSTKTPVSTDTPTATPDGGGDESLGDSIGDPTTNLTDVVGNTTDGVTDLVSGEASDGDGTNDDVLL